MGCILVVPAREKGRGGGHLVRCTKLVAELQALGKEAVLYESANYTNLHELNIDFIILDRFQTPKAELAKWKALAPVIGIDEGGDCRDEFDFLIDILPNLERIKPNISDIGLLPLPEKKPYTAAQRHSVLISFGMEDSAGLGIKTAQSLSKINDGSMDITLLSNTWDQESGVRGQGFIPNLSEHLHEYDLVITHFGITAFEASYAGTKVILINPTKYHEKLSKKAGFQTSTIKNIKNKLGSIRINSYQFGVKNSLSKLISSFSPRINRQCPVCTEPAPKKAVARFTDRTYRKCEKCGIIFMDRLTPAPISYGKEYFFEEYKKQYGKTYLEDFPNLVTTAKRRLDVIKGGRSQDCRSKVNPDVTGKDNKQKTDPRSPTSDPRILDIGCAYGAFLAAAKEEGFEPCGIDPCFEAVEYVKEKLGINAIQSFFPIPSNNNPVPCSLFPVPFEAVTLWFTIEHFKNCNSVFKEIHPLLVKNGILAFSTPSFSGISGRKNLRRFLEQSPADHYTIWSPASCKKALALHGFKVVKIVNTGRHPERFPLFGKIARCKKSPLYWVLLAISRLFSLGDTFEVYAKDFHGSNLL